MSEEYIRRVMNKPLKEGLGKGFGQGLFDKDSVLTSKPVNPEPEETKDRYVLIEVDDGDEYFIENIEPVRKLEPGEEILFTGPTVKYIKDRLAEMNRQDILDVVKITMRPNIQESVENKPEVISEDDNDHADDTMEKLDDVGAILDDQPGEDQEADTEDHTPQAADKQKGAEQDDKAGMANQYSQLASALKAALDAANFKMMDGNSVFGKLGKEETNGTASMHFACILCALHHGLNVTKE